MDKGQGSAVSTLWARWSAFRSPAKRKVFSLLQIAQTRHGPIQSLIQWVKYLIPGSKEAEVWYWPLTLI